MHLVILKYLRVSMEAPRGDMRGLLRERVNMGIPGVPSSPVWTLVQSGVPITTGVPHLASPASRPPAGSPGRPPRGWDECGQLPPPELGPFWPMAAEKLRELLQQRK